MVIWDSLYKRFFQIDQTAYDINTESDYDKFAQYKYQVISEIIHSN